MKLILALSVLVFSVGANADTNVVGDWAYANRSCKSGAQPNPAVAPPEGAISLSLTAMTFSGSSSGCNFVVGPVPVTIASGKITPTVQKTTTFVTCPNGSTYTFADTDVEEFAYSVAGNTLSIATPAETASGGTCPVGDVQIIDFARTN